MYAIVDIETTGGHADSNGITEIAIYVYDGNSIVNQFTSLVNPMVAIPAFLEQYTGITNKMVSKAPIFSAIAPTIYKLLKDNIFVAHNVNFDYSFIHHQLKACGYLLATKKLCTVRLSRRIFPGYKSYSLGNICNSLAIPLSNRHRAAGDAMATVKLFEKILKSDPSLVVIEALKKGSKEYTLPPHLPKEQFDKLPQQTGVYFFHNKEGKVIYVGKAKNIKARVTSHFSGNKPNKQKQDFLRNIYSFSFTACGTELMAYILESVEIKKHWPEFNRALKKVDFNFAIYCYTDRNEYLRLAIDKLRKNITAVATFKTQIEGIQMLQFMVSKFELCPKFCAINTSQKMCRELPELSCKGACEKKVLSTDYNIKVSEAIAYLTQNDSYIIIDKGLYVDEISCIVIENGKFIGMGYAPITSKKNTFEYYKSFITPHKTSFYIADILQSDQLTQSAQIIKFSE